VARTIFCSVVEVPAMSDSLRAQGLRGFHDLVPWADPYIAALIDKLRQAEDAEEGLEAVDELPPPLDNGDPNRDSPWQTDWSPRNWPRE
jgi:hypothetical protein